MYLLACNVTRAVMRIHTHMALFTHPVLSDFQVFGVGCVQQIHSPRTILIGLCGRLKLLTFSGWVAWVHTVHRAPIPAFQKAKGSV